QIHRFRWTVAVVVGVHPCHNRVGSTASRCLGFELPQPLVLVSPLARAVVVLPITKMEDAVLVHLDAAGLIAFAFAGHKEFPFLWPAFCFRRNAIHWKFLRQRPGVSATLGKLASRYQNAADLLPAHAG